MTMLLVLGTAIAAIEKNGKTLFSRKETFGYKNSI